MERGHAACPSGPKLVRLLFSGDETLSGFARSQGIRVGKLRDLLRELAGETHRDLVGSLARSEMACSSLTRRLQLRLGAILRGAQPEAEGAVDPAGDCERLTHRLFVAHHRRAALRRELAQAVRRPDGLPVAGLPARPRTLLSGGAEPE